MRTTAPRAGEVDVDQAERTLMNHRGWCGVPDGTACLDCRQTAIEAVAALRACTRLQYPEGVASFVDLRQVNDVWHYDFALEHPDVLLVTQALRSPQCMGTAAEAARVIVAGFARYDMLRA